MKIIFTSLKKGLVLLVLLFALLPKTKSQTCQALNFGGSYDYVQMSPFSFGNNWTIEAWIRPSNVNLGWWTVLSQAHWAANEGFALAIYSGSVFINSPAPSNVYIQAPISANVWCHIAVTYNNGVWAFYKDGILAGTQAGSYTNSSWPFFLGIREDNVTFGSLIDHYQGDMDEVRIWNVTREQCEILEYKNCEIPSTATGLVANYHFNEGNTLGLNTFVTSLNDAAGSNTGTLNNFNLALLNYTSNWIISGFPSSGNTTPASASTSTTTIKGNGVSITDGASTSSTADFTDFNGQPKRTFVIGNTGTSTLNVAPPVFTGPSANEFSVTQTPPSFLAAGTGTGNITIAFTPTSLGAKSATVNTYNTDCSKPFYKYTITATAVAGAALDFDGSDDYVETGANLAELGQGDFTIEAWIKTTGYSEGIVTCADGNTSWDAGEKCLYIDASGYPAFVGYGNGYIPGNITVNDGNWHHVAVVWDYLGGTSGTAKMYVDGVDHTGASSYSANNNNLGTFKIGKTNYNGYTPEAPNFFSGSIDEVRVWNRPLCLPEIQNNMYCELPSPSSYSGLNGYYKFNTGIAFGANSTVTSAPDAAVFTNNGTLLNFALYGPSSNWSSPGAVTSGSTCGTYLDKEITIRGNGIVINNGASTPTISNYTDFGSVGLGSILSRTFVIQNTGALPLTVSSSGLSGANASSFTITTSPASSISGSGSSNIVVSFSAAALGSKTASLTIVSNDCDEPNSIFVISATGAPAAEALIFDGINDYVTMADPNFGTSDCTIETWFNQTSSTSGGYLVTSRSTEGGPSGNWWAVAIGTGTNQGSLTMELADAGLGYIAYTTAPGLFSTGSWNHAAVVRSGTSIRIYINGILRLSATDAGVRNWVTGNNVMRLGGWPEWNGAWFLGKLDETRVWNVARTQCEIQSYMTCEIPTSSAGLVANYHFTQGADGQANPTVLNLTDASASARTGTLNNFSLSGTSSNWIAPGGVTTGNYAVSIPNVEIDIRGNGNSIIDGNTSVSAIDYTDFNGAFTRTFTIHNTITGGTLDIGTPFLTGNNASQFTITTLPASSLVGISSTSMVIAFTPTALGTYTATVNLFNNDCSEPQYDFVISASVVAGAALNFDGVNDYVDLGPSSSLKPTAALTAEAWIYKSSWPSIDQTFLGNTEFNGYGILSESANGNLEGYVRRNNTWGITGTPMSSITAGWHHVALTFDGRYTRLYLDGIQKSVDDAGATYTINYNTFNSTLIGAEASSGSTPVAGWYFNGSIDQVRLWSVARSQCEIQSYMNCEIPGSASGLIANYLFNQGLAGGTNTTVTSLTDAGGSSFTGTLYAMSLSGASSNWIAPGGVISGSTTPGPPTASILVSGNSVSITPGSASTSTLNFTNFGNASTKTFVIQNSATGTLNISAPYFSGTNASEFSVSVMPSLSLTASGTTSFVVAFTPTANGFRTATLNINSNDCGIPVFSCAIGGTPTPASVLEFDGVNDYVSIPSVSSMSFGTSTDVTAEAMVQFTANLNGFYGVVVKADASGPWHGYQLAIVQNKIAAEIGSSTGFVGTVQGLWGSTLINDGLWHHLALVISRSTNTARLYVDGNLEASVTNTAISGDINSTAATFIGSERTNVGWMNGKIDEVRIWNTARTQCQIQTFMNCEIPTTASGLLANYHFNQGSLLVDNTGISSLTDAAGTNNGTLNTFALTGATSNWAGPGPFANGYTISVAPTGTLTISGNGNNVPQGSSTGTNNFTDFGANTSRTFVLQNPGAGGLHVNTISFTGANASDFSVSTLPSTLIAGAGSSSFAISFSPTVVGSESAIVTINSSDCSNPNYSFAITASTSPASALNFDGVNDMVAISYTQALTDVTDEFWFKTTQSTGDLFSIINTSISPIAFDRDIYLNSGNVTAYLWLGASSQVIASSGTNYADGNWHHVAYVISSSSGQELYVDGVLKASGTATASGNTSGYFVSLGFGPGSANHYINGTIDEVRLWNTARTQCEIQTYMNCEIPSTMAGLAANYHFNQGVPSGSNAAVTTLTDAAAGNSGFLSGFTLNGGSSNWINPSVITSGYTTAAIPAATIGLSGNSNNIAFGSTSTSTLNGTDLGFNTSGTFVIANTGSGTLNINNISFTGTNAAQFGVSSLPASSLTGSGTSSFVVTFTPNAIGITTVALNVSSSDCTHPTYSFVITVSTSPASALNFDGTDDQVTLPAMNFTAATIALEGWFYANGLQLASSGLIFHRGCSTCGTSAGLIIASSDNTRLGYVWADGQYGWTGGPVYPLNTWFHAALVVEPTKATIYLNGVPYVNNATHVLQTFSGNTLLGRDAETCCGNRHFKGSMDEVRVWNTSRTACQIQTYMNCEIPGSSTGLIANYHFNEGVPSGSNTAVTTLTDAAGSNNGTLNFFGLTGTTSNWISPSSIASGYSTATVPSATLTVSGNGNNVPIGATTSTNNFTDFDANTSRTFAITNPGSNPLYVTDGTFTGANASNFSVTTIPSTLIAGSSSSSFVISFTPTAVGSQSAILTISSSDCTNPSYSFVVTASTSPASALNFDGVNDFVSLPGTAPVPTGNSPYTIEAWIKPSTSSNLGIIGWGNYGVNNQVNAFRLGIGGVLVNYWFGNDLTVSAPTLTNGSWHHVAATYDGNTRAIYVDGILAGSDYPTGLAVPNNNNLKIGVTCPVSCSGGPEFFNGGMDELRVWNVGRNQCQIQQYMSAEITSTASGLILNYHFNQGIPSGSNTSITSLTDAAGSNNGTLTSFNLTGSSSNWVSPGPFANGSTTLATPSVTLSVSGNGNNVPTGSSTSTNNFTDFGTNTSRTFTISNTSGTLNIQPIYFTGPNAAQFSVTTVPASTIASGSTGFVITLTPINIGISSATVNIPSNDCTNPTYSFVITASTSPAAAMNFDGSDDFVAINNTTALDNIITGNFSFEAWVKPTTNKLHTIISKGDGSGVPGTGEYIFQITASNQLSFYHTALNDWKYGSAAIPMNAWTHVAVTYDGVHLKFYINGLLDATVTSSVNTNTTGNNPVYLGSQGYNCLCNRLQGSLDEVRVWTVARTQCEILTYMNCEIPTTASGLLANYHFNQGIPSGSNATYSLVTDGTGVNTGTVSNMSLSGPTSNWVSPGGVTSGSTTAAQPTSTLVISGNSNSITPGSTSASTINLTDFGTASSRTFVVQNTGTGALYIGNGLFSGANASNFSVTTIPSTLLTSGATSSVVISFTPSSVGTHSAIFTVYSSDCSHPEYSFAITATAPPASALDFDGVDDFVSIPSGISLNNQSFSIEFWAKRTGTSQNILIGQGSSFSANQALHIGFRSIPTSSIFTFAFYGNDINYTTTAAVDGNYHHWACVYDNTATGTNRFVYLDGALVMSDHSPSAFQGTGPLIIGDVGYFGNPFHGDVDELRIWNTARTQCQIQTCMNAEITGSVTGLIGNFHFNEGLPSGANPTYTTLINDTGGPNGTLNGFGLSGSSSNWIAPAMIANGSTITSVPGASISLSGNSSPINNNSTSTSTLNFTDFGATTSRTFVIQNNGSGTLNDVNLLITGLNSSEFSVTVPPSPTLAALATTSFVVAFTPTTMGTRSATVNINTNDCVNNIFNFAVAATATAASALKFDGVDDEVNGPVNAAFDFTTGTVEGWLKLGPANFNNCFASMRNGSTARWSLHANASTGHIDIYNGSSVGTMSVPLSPNTWYHVAFVMTNSNTLLYLNGVYSGSTNIAFNSSATGLPFNIGTTNDPATTSEHFSGTMDEVRIWNRALCQAEVQNNMNCEITSTVSGLVAAYHFNQGIASGINTVTVLNDATANAFNGTLTAFALAGNASNWVNPGAVTSGSSCSAFTAPEINVTHNTINIPDGTAVPTATDGTDYGAISTTSVTISTFTIQNTGLSNLSVASMSMSGANANSFSITALSPASPIIPGSSATFAVMFGPTTSGLQTATLNINNNDCDESVYDFVFSGSSNTAAAFAFDGVDDYVNCGNILTASYTKEAWIKVGASTNGNNLISTGTGAQGSVFWVPGTTTYDLSAGHDGNWTQVQDPTPLVLGTWYHVAVSYDAPSKTMNLYKNGILVSSNTAVNPFSGTNPLQIGAFNGTFVVNGAMDEVRIWNRALCPSEILNNMNCEVAATAYGLIANYHFNQGIGYGANATNSVVLDATSAHTGTLVGTALSGTISNWMEPGAVISGSSCPVITVPEIDVNGNGISITDGSTVSASNNNTDFGGVCINTVTVRTYTVQNTGTGNLTVSSITLGGAQASMFTAGALSPASPIAPGGSAVFSVTFAPNATGTKTAVITITNNDCNESPYDFVITGTCNPLPVVTATTTNSVICNGSSVTLNGNGADTYTWTGGIPTVTNGIPFTPSTTLSYTVVGTNTLTGCTSTNLAMQSITVNPTPTLAATISQSLICNGSSVIITPANALTYTLNPGGSTGTGFTVSPSANTSYSISGTDVNGCQSASPAIISVTVNSLPIVTATASNPVICSTGTTSLIGGGADTYTWTGGILNNTSFTPSVTTSYTVTGTYTLTGCTSTNVAIQTITVDAVPNVTASANSSVICIGETATLTASGASTYTWNPGNFIGTVYNPTPSVQTSYTVIGTNSAGCTSTNVAVQTISINALPTVSASISSATICFGNTITVSGSGADTYTWTNGVPDGIAFTPTLSGTYSVSGTNTLTGCTSTNAPSVSITVNSIPNLSITISKPALCLGDQTSLSASGALSYTWSGGINDNVAFTPSITSAYTLTATDVNSCTNTAVATITVNSLPVLSVTASSSISCEAQTTTLSAGGASNYTWSSGETTPDIVITPTATSNFTILALDANTCTNTLVYTQSVIPCPGTFTASAITKNVSCSGKNDGEISISVVNSYSNPLLSYHWSPSALCPASDCDSLKHLPSGTYNLTITITYTLNGTLVKTDSLVMAPIIITDLNGQCEVTVYKGITANGDNLNDVLTIENIEEFPANTVTIFNRWGQEVFKTNGYNNVEKVWPLRSEVSKIPANTYFYVIDLGNGSSPIKGWIELIKD